MKLLKKRTPYKKLSKKAKLKIANNLLDIQGNSGNWDVNTYMTGLYNGMELMLSIFEDREPVYRDIPEKVGD